MSRPARLVAERCFPSHSPYSSTLDHAFAAGDACLRGGALEPGACVSTEKGIGKPRLNVSVSFSAPSSAWDLISLGRGLNSIYVFFKLSIILPRASLRLRNKKATRLGRPRCESYAASELARTPPGEGRDGLGVASNGGDACWPL